MKIQCSQIKIFLYFFTAFITIFNTQKIYAQACPGNHITVSMQNFSSTANSFEFDIYLKNDGINVMTFASLQGGFTYPLGFIPTGCSLSGSCIEQPSTTGNFPNFTNLSAINHDVPNLQMRWTNNPPMNAATAVPIPIGVDLKFARLKFTLSTGCIFPNCTPLNLVWNDESLPLQFQKVRPLVYCNGNPNSAVLLGSNVTLIGPQNVTINCSNNCPSTINTTIQPLCYGDTIGNVDIKLISTTSTTGSYVLNSASSVNYTSNPFTLSGLHVGNYTLVATSDTGCAPITTQFTISAPSNPLTNSTTITSCNQYTWPITGVTYTNSGIYTGTSSSSNGCSIEETLNLTITPITVNITNDTSCGSYTWVVNNTTYTSSGNYGILNNCVADSLHLSIQPFQTSTVNLTAYGYYTWPKNGVTYIHNGTYVSNKPCSSDTLKLIVVPNSINENNNLYSSIILKPNPTRDNTVLELNTPTSSTIELSLYDLTGRRLKNINADCMAGLNLIKLDLSDLAPSIYTLRIAEQHKIRHTIKIQKID